MRAKPIPLPSLQQPRLGFLNVACKETDIVATIWFMESGTCHRTPSTPKQESRWKFKAGHRTSYPSRSRSENDCDGGPQWVNRKQRPGVHFARTSFSLRAREKLGHVGTLIYHD